MTGEFPELKLWSKDFVELGYLGDPESVTGSLRHNQVSSLTVTVRASHHLAGILQTEGVRITVDYLGERIFSGPMRSCGTSGGATGDSKTQATFEDDLRLLWRKLAWPNPGRVITDQAWDEYEVAQGPAETVLKGVLSRNLHRPGEPAEPITIAPDRGRGAAIKVQNRFNSIAELTLPLVDGAGIGISVVQQGAGLVVDAYVPADRSGVPLIAGEDGQISEWSISRTAPEATDVIIGGSGEGTLRQFERRTNRARELLWGDRIEKLIDAQQSQTTQDLWDSGDVELKSADEKAGLKVTLMETDTFRYGGPGGLHRGDKISVLTGDITYTDVLREATLNWTADDGLTITPTIGDGSENVVQALISKVASLSRRINKFSTR